MKNGNRNYLKRTNGEYRYTMHLRRARELNWALYITEGYVANLNHAVEVNAFTLQKDALAALKEVHAEAEQLAIKVRELIAREMKE